MRKIFEFEINILKNIIYFCENIKTKMNITNIVEIARIGTRQTIPYDVFVNGGDSYGKGRNEHGEPHFHFSDNIKGGGKFSFSILIPTPTEWSNNKDLTIIESNTGSNEWKKFKNEKKALIIWLDKPNNITNEFTNLQFIRLQWNTLNIDNKNVKQLDSIK